MLDKNKTKKHLAESDTLLIEFKKELRCLYELSRIIEINEITLDEIYRKIVELVPSAWEYPEITCARLTIDGKEFKTANYRETKWRQSADIKCGDINAGTLLVGYLEERPVSDEGPFLKEERQLINNIAERLGLVTERMQATERLMQSENQLKLTFESTADCIAVADLNGVIKKANSKAAEIGGYSTIDELLGKTFFDFVVARDHQYVKEQLQKTLELGIVKDVLVSLVRKDGSEFPAEVSAGLLQNAPASPTGFVITFRDVSVRRKAEEDSKMKSELLDLESDSVYVSDLGNNLIYVNKSACIKAGYTQEELLNNTIVKKFITESSGFVESNMREVLKAGQTTFDFNMVRKNGSLIPMEMHVSILEISGKQVMMGVARDMTERRKAEEATKLQAELLDLESDFVYVTDLKRNLVYANKSACFISGYTNEELLNMNSSEIIVDAGLPFESNMKEILEKGQTILEVNHRRKNGSTIPLEVHATLIEVGGRKMILGVGRDLTERNKILEQLLAQDRLASIGLLMAGVAHEIKNPLTSVLGFSELMLTNPGCKDCYDDLRIVNDETKRTLQIVNNLLTFARKQPEGKAGVQINEKINKVLALRAHDQKENNIQVISHLAPDLPLVMGNGSQLEQVFFNLVVNAEQAILEVHNKGTLTITTERAGDIVRVSIADDGPGISPSNMKKLFVPFFTTKPVGKGTGLGLSICHGIVTEHGGKIYAKSEVGKGATFIVELPYPK